jgi:hypothetical protein
MRKFLEKIGGKIYGGIEVGLKGEGGLGLSFNKEDTIFDKREITQTKTGRNILRFVSIQRKIEEVLELLNIETITIFVDEWSSLRRNLQPKFANLLRHTFFNTSKICLKISAIKLRSNMFERSKDGYIGFELGADIFPPIDLDLELLYKERKSIPVHFYEEMLFKHLRINHHGLDKFIKNDELSQDFLETIFDKKETFVELIIASNGIPRDFLNIFVQSNEFISAKKGKKGKSKITTVSIIKASYNWYLKDKAGFTDEPYLKSLLTSIIKLATRKKIYSFLVDSIYSSREELNDLMDHRIIHQIPDNVVDPRIRTQYSVFLIDYGLCADYFSDPLGEKNFLKYTCQLSPDEIPIDNMIIDIVSLGKSRSGKKYENTCPKCSNNFPIYDELFKKRGLCPLCYSIINEEKYLKPFRAKLKPSKSHSK